MKHEWTVNITGGVQNVVCCATCGDELIIGTSWMTGWGFSALAERVASNCPGPPKAKPLLPAKVPEMGVALTVAERRLGTTLNALIDYLYAKENE